MRLPRRHARALRAALLLLGTPLALGAQQAAKATVDRPAPPVAERRVHVDTLHGDVRVDPYFWLRVKDDPAVKSYLEAENAYAKSVLAHTEPAQARLYEEMLSRIKQTDLSVPYRQRGYLYYNRTEEGKQYPILARKKGSLAAPEAVMLDVNELAKGQVFMGLGAANVSDDDNLLAYSTDSTGFRQYVLRVKDLRTGQVLPDRREKVVSVTWAADNRTLFYTVEDPAKRSYRVYRHALGQETDDLVYEEKDERFGVYVGRGRSGKFLYMQSGSHTTSEVRYLAADDPMGEWKVVSPRKQDVEYSVDDHIDRFYIRVNDKGRNFRLVSAPASDPSPANWTEVVPHRADATIEDFDLFANHLVVSERRNGLNEIVVTDLRTGKSHDVAFPEPVYSAGVSVNREWDTPVLRYAYQSLVTPSSVFDYDMEKRTSTLLKQTEVLGGYDKGQYQSERIFARASDGTRVPISLVYRKGVKRDGSAPMLLQGYGSYGIPSDVGFSSNRLSLLDRGVVVATAHIRGGGDMGQAWHDHGKMKEKMNTFTDFIAAADHLVKERYTSKDKLVIQGGSAGGLLMGAVTNMRPDLFKAVIAQVPFVDVVNTMLDETLPLTVGEFEEWGNPKKKDEYEYIKRYDPYTNVAAKAYPAMLVKTSFNDSQVSYHEPAKWVSKLRANRTDANPLLLVTNMGAGHGGASGRYDRLKEIALDYSFLLWQVGLLNEVKP